MDKTFDAAEAEGRIYARWEAEGAFRQPNPGDPGFDAALLADHSSESAALVLRSWLRAIVEGTASTTGAEVQSGAKPVHAGFAR